MTHPVLRTDGEQRLLCPNCPTDAVSYTHVEHVLISARKEDQATNEIQVNAVSGAVSTHNTAVAPAGTQVGHGRRHRISLVGLCENCGGSFALVFTQHKGVTFVEVVPASIPA